MRPTHAASVVLALFLGGATSAQMVLSTTFIDDNTCAANYFDIVANGGKAVRILSFDGHFSARPTVDIEIWTKAGSWQGFTSTPAAWTMVGAAAGVPTMPRGTPTPIPIPINVLILPGQYQGFLVQTTNPYVNSLRYTNGSWIGAVYTSDPYLTILEGAPSCSLTPGSGHLSVPRIWNGNIYYDPVQVTTFRVGVFHPAQPVAAVNGEAGVVLVQAELSATSTTSVTSMDLVASGTGDDLAGVAQVQVWQEDQATINGLVDGLDMMIASGTYPVDDGTFTVTPTINLLPGVTESLLFVYDFTGTAAGATPPADYAVTVNNLVAVGVILTPGGDPSGQALVDGLCPLVLCGDCNSDGSVSIVDALTAAQHAVGLITLTGVEFSNCNVLGIVEPDPGAAVNTLDALNIAQVAAGLSVTLACCVP